MKVLIVDDEEHVREAIELSIDWKKYGITERLMAEDGAQAIEFIRLHKPAIVFCDMSMPVMDGPELLQKLREENNEIQVIVVSGYDAFHYTRAAIRAWGVDYLLKPFRKSDLEQALDRAVAAWRENESLKLGHIETEHRLKQVDALLDEQKLASYLKGEVPFQEGIRRLIYKVDQTNAGTWAVLVLPRNRIDLVNGRFDGDVELFVFAVNNIAHEILSSYGSYTFCRLDPYQWVLLISGEEKMGDVSVLQDYMRRLSIAWQKTLGLSTFIGVAGGLAVVENLAAAVGDARKSLMNSMVLGTKRHPEPSSPTPRLSDQKVLLETTLASRNKPYAAEVIHAFVLKLRERGSLSLKELQACTLDANLLLERASRSGLSSKEIPDLMLPLWISDLEEWEKLLVQQWWRLIEDSSTEGSGNHGIESMRQYMDQHYQEDISLSSLSERFHFSPQYIAKKFKELYNTTVITYLTELRMEKARSLLAHTGLSVLEISEKLGYSDENYFGKVFKKQTGFSPLQYRKQEQQKGTSK